MAFHMKVLLQGGTITFSWKLHLSISWIAMHHLLLSLISGLVYLLSILFYIIIVFWLLIVAPILLHITHENLKENRIFGARFNQDEISSIQFPLFVMHQHFSNLTNSKIKKTYNVLQPPQFWSQNLKMRLVYSHASVFKDLSNYLFPMARFWTVTSGSFWLTTSLRLKPYLFDSTKGRLACFVDWNTSQLLAKAPAKRPKWQIAILLRFSVSVSITWFETTSYPGHNSWH